MAGDAERGEAALRGMVQGLTAAAYKSADDQLKVHHLAVLAVTADGVARYIIPGTVRPGDLLIIARAGFVFWRLATGSEVGSVVSVSHHDGHPGSPPGWGQAVHEPVLRWGKPADFEERRMLTLGRVDDDGVLRSPATGEELGLEW